jgi:hypothetical protein
MAATWVFVAVFFVDMEHPLADTGRSRIRHPSVARDKRIGKIRVSGPLS